MTDHTLVPHPETPPRAVQSITVEVRRCGRTTHVRYGVACAPRNLALPPPAEAERTDGLWRTTCFELFWATGPETYCEANFATSSQWACYGFEGYRTAMQAVALEHVPSVLIADRTDALVVTVSIDLPGHPTGSVGLCCVIEEIDGTKSYWALAHAPGPPDFHNRDCFIATLPAPERA